tara:strand:- start:1481 stop:1645 length:165 start_codon:yes stop_codon:yes gene_type:complete
MFNINEIVLVEKAANKNLEIKQLLKRAKYKRILVNYNNENFTTFMGDLYLDGRF